MSYPLTIERVSVQRDRLSLLVRLAAEAPSALPPKAADHLLQARPMLALHTCLNDRDVSFQDELRTASLPHVLEHLIIDFQAHDPACATDQTFVGTTEWLNQAEGLARVEVSFTDDLAALRALKEAWGLLRESLT